MPDEFLESCKHFTLDNSNYSMMAHVYAWIRVFWKCKVAYQHGYAIISEMSCHLEMLKKQKENIAALDIWISSVSVKFIHKTLQTKAHEITINLV